MKPAPKPKRTADHVVKDLSLASWGRKEIAIAEVEMPGLMAIREEFGPVQPLRGARIRAATRAGVSPSRRSGSAAWADRTASCRPARVPCG